MRGHVLSLGLHEGVISSELWLEVQRKLDGNSQIKKGKNGSYSWLSGMIKCGKCGYAMRVMGRRYFYCSGKANHQLCGGLDGKPEIYDVEDAVYHELVKKFDEIRDITVENRKSASPKLNRLKMRLETLNTQIDNLVDKITETSAAVGKALEEKLERLILEREDALEELDKFRGAAKPKHAYEDIIYMIYDFPDMPLDSKREIARQFIEKVLLWEDKIEIIWKF